MEMRGAFASEQYNLGDVDTGDLRHQTTTVAVL